jgi:hypothetical protein
VVVGPPAIGARTIGQFGKIRRVGELDGTWNVYRTGGLLPPLYGVHKRIEGSSGSTRIGPLVGVPFDVVGLELRYRAPFLGFVDVLTPRDDGAYDGRATFRGRTFGTFGLTRSSQK